MLSKKETELLDALEPRAASEGVEIVTVQVVGAKKAPTIRVFIDTPEGVSFDELAKAQAWINDIMDALDPFPGAYTLEVSSPGIDRPLRTEQHFARYAGQQAVVKLAHPIDGRSNFTGTIVSAHDGNVVMDVDGQQAVLPHQHLASLAAGRGAVVPDNGGQHGVMALFPLIYQRLKNGIHW